MQSKAIMTVQDAAGSSGLSALLEPKGDASGDARRGPDDRLWLAWKGEPCRDSAAVHNSEL